MKQHRNSIAMAVAMCLSTAVFGDEPITGEALRLASAAALQYTGGGRVTETEIGDEESFYEVEVTLASGQQIDVHLDESFRVISSEREDEPDNDAGEAEAEAEAEDEDEDDEDEAADD